MNTFSTSFNQFKKSPLVNNTTIDNAYPHNTSSLLFNERREWIKQVHLILSVPPVTVA